MAETAVGLFEDAGTAEAVVDALRANGIPSRGIRILAKPVGSPVVSATSTPSVDFAASLRICARWARRSLNVTRIWPECDVATCSCLRQAPVFKRKQRSP
jgi:hypothetical protein